MHARNNINNVNKSRDAAVRRISLLHLSAQDGKGISNGGAGETHLEERRTCAKVGLSIIIIRLISISISGGILLARVKLESSYVTKATW